MAVAQFGPGKGNGPNGRDDFGRMNVTGLAADKYTFRTTPLRNVVLTGPYGHDDAIASLRGFIDHYSESDLKLRNFSITGLEPLLQSTLIANFDDALANRDTVLNGVVLPSATIDPGDLYDGTHRSGGAESRAQRPPPGAERAQDRPAARARHVLVGMRTRLARRAGFLCVWAAGRTFRLPSPPSPS